ncbi:hypothetical protein JCM8547_003856 [Rhodosporidiobolus lusitaniae]
MVMTGHRDVLRLKVADLQTLMKELQDHLAARSNSPSPPPPPSSAATSSPSLSEPVSNPSSATRRSDLPSPPPYERALRLDADLNGQSSSVHRRINSKLSEHAATFSTLRQQHDALKASISSLETAHSRLQAEHAALHRSSSPSREAVEESESILRGHLDAAEKKVKELEREKEENKEKVEEMKRKAVKRYKES